MSPVYDYSCNVGHTFERRAGYEDSEVECEVCGWPAFRHAAYPNQSVAFVGSDFTRVVIPPKFPKMPDHGKSRVPDPDDSFGVIDEYARKTYDYDKNVRPYVKDMIKKEAKRQGLVGGEEENGQEK